MLEMPVELDERSSIVPLVYMLSGPESPLTTSGVQEMDGTSLVAGLFERFGADFGLTEYKRTPPDLDLDPVYVDMIDAAPAGGIARNPDGPWIWCSECERPKFWYGIALTNETGALYLIGNQCAERFFGVDRARSARSAWKSRLEMQRAKERFRRCRNVAAAVRDDLKPFRKASTWQALDGARRQLRRSAPDLLIRLASAVANNDGVLTVMEPFVDTQGKSQLARRSIGRLAGASILGEVGTEKIAADSAHDAIQNVCAANDLTTLSAFDLNSLAQGMEDAATEMLTCIDSATAAHRFFDESNLTRVAAFAQQMRRLYQIEVGIGVLECLRGGKHYRVDAFEKLDVPSCDHVRAFCSGK
jgi:hypothetical protein